MRVPGAGRPELLIGLAIFVTTFAFYLHYLAPSAYDGDAAEFATAVPLLGITHPPGYPLLILLGYPFSRLPLGSPAVMVNALSALFAAGAVACVFLLCVAVQDILGRPRWLGLGSSVLASSLFALSAPLWDFAEYASVRTMETFFLALSLLLLVRWSGAPRERTLVVPAFAFGLALASHVSNALYLPALLAFVLLVDRASIAPRRWPRLLLALAPGPLLYLYVLIRSTQSPPFAWGLAPDLVHWLGYVSGRPFQDLPFAYGRYAIPFRVLTFDDTLRISYSFPVLLMAGVGVLELLRRAPRFLVLLGIIGANNLIYFTNYRGADYGMFLPAVLTIAVLAAIGLGAGGHQLLAIMRAPGLGGMLSSRRRAVVLAVAMALPLLVLPLAGFETAVPYLDRSRDDWSTYSTALLRSLPAGSVIITDRSERGWDYSLDYLRLVEHVRPDVALVDTPRTTWATVAGRLLADGHRVFIPASGKALVNPLVAIPYLLSLDEGGALEVVPSPPARASNSTVPPGKLISCSLQSRGGGGADRLIQIMPCWAGGGGLDDYTLRLRITAPDRVDEIPFPIGYNLYPTSSWAAGATFHESYFVFLPRLAGQVKLEMVFVRSGVEMSGSAKNVASVTLD